MAGNPVVYNSTDGGSTMRCDCSSFREQTVVFPFLVHCFWRVAGDRVGPVQSRTRACESGAYDLGAPFTSIPAMAAVVGTHFFPPGAWSDRFDRVYIRVRSRDRRHVW